MLWVLECRAFGLGVTVEGMGLSTDSGLTSSEAFWGEGLRAPGIFLVLVLVRADVRHW